ncbi:hypothetical protein [Natronobacterium haloterrestre]|uniref:hypothetical protein n=1 Tax=Natronobacterium haloterrestre TaxID=148448 RepID=UPI0011604D07|nr:hypothetical protein [Halobiforma haloterrestris]
MGHAVDVLDIGDESEFGAPLGGGATPLGEIVVTSEAAVVPRDNVLVLAVADAFNRLEDLVIGVDARVTLVAREDTEPGVNAEVDSIDAVGEFVGKLRHLVALKAKARTVLVAL